MPQSNYTTPLAKQKAGPRQLVDASTGERVPGREHFEGWIAQRHTPPHLLRDDSWYIITASTWRDQAFFVNAPVAREMCLLLDRDLQREGWIVKAYVVMPTHYHVVTKSRLGRDMPEIVRKLHGRASSLVRENLRARGGGLPESYFNNYWDTCLNTEAQWLRALEYVRMNPVRAGLVEEPEQYPYLCLRH